MPAPLPRYERSGDIDMFRLGIIGQADDEMENYVEVGLASIHDDHPVGMVAVRARYRDDEDDEGATVMLSGPDAALLAVILQDAARQWQERTLTHDWIEHGDDQD